MSTRIKVLHFYKTSWPQSVGGVESFIHTLCRSTGSLGVDNTVLSLATAPCSKPIQEGNYKIHQVKQTLSFASTGFSFEAFRKFKVLAEQADIIHFHFPNPFADMLNLFWRLNKPYIVTYHSDIIKQKWLLKLYRPLMYHFLKSASSIVSTSPNYFATSDILQLFSPKVTTIPIGIDIDDYTVPDKERLKYWKHRLPEPFFLFIGAMRYYKGLHIALDAIKGTNINLVIGGINGIESELRKKVELENIENVTFLGYVSDDDKTALLKLCYGFVFPSHLRSEAFGISLLEAAAHEKPLISCEIGTGTSFINKNNLTGLVVKPSSPIALREAMLYLLGSPRTALEFGKNAKIRANDLFTAEEQAKSYCSLYKSLT